LDEARRRRRRVLAAAPPQADQDAVAAVEVREHRLQRDEQILLRLTEEVGERA